MVAAAVAADARAAVAAIAAVAAAVAAVAGKQPFNCIEGPEAFPGLLVFSPRFARAARQLALAGLLGALAMAARAQNVDPAIANRDERVLQPYEPITGGYTFDSDDAPYVDVALSLKLRVLPIKWTTPGRLYVTFSTRFGFYLGTRESSPVIGKSYNPKLLWRYLPNESDRRNSSYGKPGVLDEFAQYFDIAYAHQSNGQSIHTPLQYQAAEQEAVLEGESADRANEYISRGWDYFEGVWKHSWGREQRIASYLDLRYFLEDGFLQGRAEEYNSWENDPQGKPRRAVDGLGALVEFQWPFRMDHDQMAVVSNPSVWVKYQTGYDTPFRFNTVRLELGVQILELPFAVWVQKGYVSDLANYYRDVKSVGVELRFGSF